MSIKKFFTPLVALLMLGAASTVITSCSKDDNPSGSQDADAEKIVYPAVDDLAYVMHSLIHYDENGEFVNYIYGEALDPENPDDLYIGVDDLYEAFDIFSLWFAPGIDLDALFSVSEEFDVPLEDLDGKSQGSITFRPGTGDTVAEVIFNTSIAARAMTRGGGKANKVIFMKNSSWPKDKDLKAHKGDIKQMSIANSTLRGVLSSDDHNPMYVCIREARNGQHPWWLALSKHDYDPDNHDKYDADEVPYLDMAKTISAELRTDFDFFKSAFAKAKGGELVWGRWYMSRSNHHSWFHRFQDAVLIPGQDTGGRRGSGESAPLLFFTNWVPDGQ